MKIQFQSNQLHYYRRLRRLKKLEEKDGLKAIRVNQPPQQNTTTTKPNHFEWILIPHAPATTIDSYNVINLEI